MPDVSYLTIDHAPNKTTYFVGDKFEKYGMVVKAHYTDGTSFTVDYFTYSPTSSTDAFTIGINTGAILAVAAFIYSLLTGQPMESPAIQYT